MPYNTFLANIYISLPDYVLNLMQVDETYYLIISFLANIYISLPDYVLNLMPVHETYYPIKQFGLHLHFTVGLCFKLYASIWDPLSHNIFLANIYYLFFTARLCFKLYTST